MSSRTSCRPALACLLGLLAAPACAATQWVAVATTADRVLYVEKLTLTRSHGVVRGWVKTVFNTPQDYPAGGTFLVMRAHETWSCPNRTVSLSHYAIFKDAAQATLLGESTSPEGGLRDARPVPPGTVSDQVLGYVCANAPRRPRPAVPVAETASN